MSKVGITLTGVDERTTWPQISELIYGGAEIGILYKFSPDGRNRYPRLSWILDILDEAGEHCAVHICGNRARTQLLAGKLHQSIAKAKRVQVNGALLPSDLAKICGYCNQEVITQHCNKNDILRFLTSVPGSNHALLVDGSGGRGITPDCWNRPRTAKQVGFAGGLGPDNLATELPKIAAVAIGDWWIDMEGKLRDDDWFDVSKAKRCLEIFNEWLARQ